MKNIIKIGLLTVSLSILGCANNPTKAVNGNSNPIQSQPTKIHTKRPVIPEIANCHATTSEIAACKEQGGEIAAMGFAQCDMCVVEFSDAGKTCQDSSDCMGGCIADDDVPMGKPNQKGQCSLNNIPFGCHNWLEKGVSQGGLCVD